MKKLHSFIKEPHNAISANILTALAFLLVALIITIILSSRYFYYQNIVENGVSNKLIKAKKRIEVVDTQKTEVIKRDIASKIRPVVMPVDENYIRANLNSLKENVLKVKFSSKDAIDKETELSSLLDIPDSQKEKAIVKYLLAASANNVENIFANANTVIDAYLKAGVTESEIEYYANETSVLNILGSATGAIQRLYQVLLSMFCSQV